MAVADGDSEDTLVAPTSCLMGALSVLVQDMYTCTTCISTMAILLYIITKIESDLTSSDVVVPVLVTVAATDTFWPALTVDGAISRSV